jgi:hypothetical protein
MGYPHTVIYPMPQKFERRVLMPTILIRLIILIGVAATISSASPIEYWNIDFALDSGSMVPSGSFEWDPGIQTFSNFFVTWDGLTFDLTTSANNPTTQPGDCASGDPRFVTISMLAGVCDGSPAGWSLQLSGTTGKVFMYSQVANDVIIASTITVPPVSQLTTSLGTANITPGAPTPEPATLLMTVMAVAFLARKRIAEATRPATLHLHVKWRIRRAA